MLVLKRLADGETLQSWPIAPAIIRLDALTSVEGASAGWSNGTYALEEVPDPPPSPPSKEALRDYAALKRWQVETGGITLTLDGLQISVSTDARTKLVLTAGYIKAIANPAYTVPSWKVAPGVYVELSAADIIAIGDAVETHVQACFAANEAVDAAIESGAYTTLSQIDAHDWPGA